MSDFPIALTAATDNVTDVLAKHINNLEAKVGIDSSAVTNSIDYLTKNMPDGYMRNGEVIPSVSSNNLTVALKGLDGNDPSATNPVCIRMGGSIRTVTAALSITVASGTNKFNAGSAELATKEIDYFVYLGYNATDGVVIGISRIPYANQYSDFSATSTNEKYCAISTTTNAAAADEYKVIGRIAAFLSASANYYWSVPAASTSNIQQKPIYETRWLDWVPAWSASGSMTYGTVSVTVAAYKICNDREVKLYLNVNSGTIGGTPSYNIICTTPFAAADICGSGCAITDNGADAVGAFYHVNSAALNFMKPAGANWTAGTTKVRFSYTMKI